MFDFPLEEMIQQQLVSRGIDDERVIEAFRRIDRTVFVPGHLMNRAYEDERLPIGVGQTLTAPYVVARMVQELRLPKDARVLEVGTGSGYQAALLAQVALKVYTIEILPELSARARKVLVDDLELPNVRFRAGDGCQGWSDEAPFDAIVVTGSVEDVPWALEGQLRKGRRIALPHGERDQTLQIWERGAKDDALSLVYEEPIRHPFSPLSGEAGE